MDACTGYFAFAPRTPPAISRWGSEPSPHFRPNHATAEICIKAARDCTKSEAEEGAIPEMEGGEPFLAARSPSPRILATYILYVCSFNNDL